MARVNPQEYVDKHARRLKASVEDIRHGVQRVTEAPGAKAAASIDQMRSGINEAVDDGRWESAVSNVSLNDWRQATLEKGLGRISAGIENSRAKNLVKAQNLLAAVDEVSAEVQNMPKGTIDDSVNRMTHFVRRMSERKGTI